MCPLQMKFNLLKADRAESAHYTYPLFCLFNRVPDRQIHHAALMANDNNFPVNVCVKNKIVLAMVGRKAILI